ncbi:hypothetical protein MXEN_05963 [Mycobacterium xenopi RIVM700367]|uniref:Uncharacterized protein n=1 Tax=Mycobacterium xenopi 4042 TaxID=1299334 RepID=X8CF05_MYCXE|nr:hypothetical protein MXEN_05963 [Mycobacterium xenopi RIVM700367]EUA54684.1 hypothetical protein I553_1626 [Mycobacterium xenopi 4042]ORX21464.1 hypothetical protein AWC32_23465 [Mycobacterium xenopi]
MRFTIVFAENPADDALLVQSAFIVFDSQFTGSLKPPLGLTRTSIFGILYLTELFSVEQIRPP